MAATRTALLSGRQVVGRQINVKGSRRRTVGTGPAWRSAHHAKGWVSQYVSSATCPLPARRRVVPPSTSQVPAGIAFSVFPPCATPVCVLYVSVSVCWYICVYVLVRPASFPCACLSAVAAYACFPSQSPCLFSRYIHLPCTWRSVISFSCCFCPTCSFRYMAICVCFPSVPLLQLLCLCEC